MATHAKLKTTDIRNYIKQTVVILPAISLLLSGCVSSKQLTMTAEIPPLDNSVISPKLDDIQCSKMMIIPPSGTARGVFEMQMVLFEREFLRQGMSVISPAITGRVVMDSPDETEAKNETASTLSDMERALVMAKATGADAILQVGAIGWVERKDNRFFVLEASSSPAFEEVSSLDYRKWKGPAVKFESPQYEFVGKVVNVENGEVLATLDVIVPANFTLPEDYVAKYSIMNNRPSLSTGSEKNFKYRVQKRQYVNGAATTKSELPWFEDAKSRAENKLIAYIAEKISLAVKKQL